MPLKSKSQVIKETCLVDDSDRLLIVGHSWFLTRHGYYQGDKKRGDNRNRIYMHHLIVGLPPRGLMVDHINRNKLDNRRSNLRFVTCSQNLINKSKRKDSKQIEKSIELLPSGNFSVKTVHGKRIGTFSNLKLAKKAYLDFVFKKYNIKYTYVTT